MGSAKTETERIEGYKIITKLGEQIISYLGYDGDTKTGPAMCESDAQKEISLSKQFPNITYGLQIIRNARYVKLSSGEIVDNGPKEPHHYT